MTRSCSTLAGALMFTVLLALAPSSARADEGLAQFMKSEKAHYGKKPLIAVSELIIRYHFRDRRDGFYVDVGCSDYKKNSTTYDLEENFGWSGIGIDPLEYLRAGWEEFRPRSKFFAYAASDKSGETLKFYSAGGLSATELDTFNLEGWKKRLDFQPKEIEVPTITISDLLDQEGVKKIDFLSMDINGAEPIALAGFDIERFAPDLVHVEVNDADELMAYFEQHGYVRIDEYLKYETSNWYFTPRK